jgi:hypothetical protein
MQKPELLRTLSRIEQKEVRWHVAPLLARLSLSSAEESSAMAVLLDYTTDRCSIVKTMAMQGLCESLAPVIAGKNAGFERFHCLRRGFSEREIAGSVGAGRATLRQ